MAKNSMKQALGASLSAETNAFQSRMARADAQFPNTGVHPSESTSATETVVVPRVVREAFTIPEAEHGQIEAIRTQMLSGAIAVSKSEVVRAGLLLLAEADVETRRTTFERLERVKTGRPKTS
jgi:hypothetical protein